MDRRQIIRSYFQARHRENRYLNSLFIEPIVEEFGLLSDYTEMIQLFGSIDEIPTEFIGGLAQSLAYEILEEENFDIQREIIKRILQVYKDRCSHRAIEKVLESSTDRNWVGGDLTLYKGPVRKGYKRIWYPGEQIFIHDKSFHDSGDAFMDYLIYNYGIICFEVQYLDERTIEMLEQQVPGGIRWNIDQLVWIPGGGEDGSDDFDRVIHYPYLTDGLDLMEDLIISHQDVYLPGDIAYFDSLPSVLKKTRGSLFNQGKLGQEQSKILTGGILGSKSNIVLSGGLLAYYKSPVRSGRYVAMADIAEEITLGTSYISYYGYLSGNTLLSLPKIKNQFKGYYEVDQYSGGNMSNKLIHRLNASIMPYPHYGSYLGGTLGQPKSKVLDGGRLGEPKGKPFRSETRLNGGILGGPKGQSFGRNIFTFDSSLHDSGAIFSAADSFNNGSLNIGRLGERRGIYTPYPEPKQPKLRRDIFSGGILGDKKGSKVLGGTLGRSLLDGTTTSFIYREVEGFELDEERKGIRFFDRNCHDDGLARESVLDNEITVYARYRELLPYDVLYGLDDVIDDRVWDNNDSYQYGFEVEVI